MRKLTFLVGFLILSFFVKGQEIDSSFVEIDSVSVDSIAIFETEIKLINPDALLCF